MPWEIPITLEDTTYPVRFNTEEAPTQADIDEAVAIIRQQRTAPTQAPVEQGRLSSFGSNVGRGALSVIPGIIGGVGYLTGSDTLTGAAKGIERGIEKILPVNPAYQEEFTQKVGNVLGQGGAMLATGGVAGAIGKGLSAARGLEATAAAAKGTQLAGRAMLGSGMLQGTYGGGQEAEKYGMTGGAAYARALLGGALEGATEKYMFGMGTELAPVKKFLGDAAERGVGGILKAAGTEAGEEAASQIGGNIATTALAPTGAETPGAFSDVLESALLGGVAGGALGGLNAVMPSGEKATPEAPVTPPTIEGETLRDFTPRTPEEQAAKAAFQALAAAPTATDPLAQTQDTVAEVAATSVVASADLLPATAAALTQAPVEEVAAEEVAPVEEDIPAQRPAATSTRVEAKPTVMGERGAAAVRVLPKQKETPVGALEPEASEVLLPEPTAPTVEEQASEGAPVQETFRPVEKEVAPVEESGVKEGMAKPVAQPTGKESVDSFVSGMTPMAAKRARNALDESVSSGGMPVQRKELIQNKVAAGATVEQKVVTDTARAKKLESLIKSMRNSVPFGNTSHPETIRFNEARAELAAGPKITTRRLVNPDGSFLAESQISKTAMDYAEHLISQKPSPLPPAEAETKPQPTTPKTNATIEGQVPEIRVEERVNASEGRQTPEAGSRNRPVSSGQVEEAKGQEEVGKAEAPPPVAETRGEGAPVRASEANAGKIDNSKVHPSLISADGTRKQLYHGKAGEFPDAELKLNPNSVTTLSGIGPAWFTTNKAQAYRFSVPKGNIMAPDMIALKKPLIIEGDDASISRGKMLRSLLDFDKGNRIKNKSRFQWSEQEAQEWSEFYPRIKEFLESEGVKKFKNGDSLAKFDRLEQMGANPNHIPITDEFRRRLDVAYRDLNHPDADPLNKLQKLEKEARVTLRLEGNPLADKMPSGDAIRLALQSEGYDGVVLLNTMADTAAGELGEGYNPSDWVVPFTPEQVVSEVSQKEAKGQEKEVEKIAPEPRKQRKFAISPISDMLYEQRSETELQQRQDEWREKQTERITSRDILSADWEKIRDDIQRGRRGLTVEKAIAMVDDAFEQGAIPKQWHEVLTKKVGKAEAPPPVAETQGEGISQAEQSWRKRIGKLLGDANRKEGSPPRIEMLDEARELWKTEKEYRYNRLVRLRDDIATLIQTSLDFDKINSVKMAEALIEGRPNLVDKIARLAPVKQSEMVNAGSRPSALEALGYERGERGVYTHSKYQAQTPVAETKIETDLREKGLTTKEAPPPPIAETEAPIVTEDFGAKNKLFSREKAEASGKRLRDWRGQTSMGIDPSKIVDAINFAGYYLEGGARSFADFSATMVDKLGDWVTPYLRQWYEAVRYHPGFDSTGMDSPAEVSSSLLPTPVELTEQPERTLPEKPIMPSEGPIGISNAEMDKEAEKLGNLPINRPVQKVIGDEQLAQMALNEFVRDPKVGERLVSDMMKSPRVISSLEQAILGFEIVARHNILTKATEAYLANPTESTKNDWELAQSAYSDVQYANSIAGADVGRALRYRRMMLNLDFTLAGMVNAFKAAGNGAAVSKEQADAIAKIQTEYANLVKERDELLKKQEEQDAKIDPAILDEMLAKAKEEGLLEGRTAARVEERARQEIEAAKKQAARSKEPKESIWKKIRADAELRIANRRGKVYNDVFMLNTVATAADHVLIGASYIAEGITNITDWIAAMKAVVPDLPDSQMQEVYDEGKALVDEEAAATVAPQEPKTKPVKKTKPKAIEKVVTLATEGKELTHRAVYDLVKEKLVAGVAKEKVMEEVTKDLQEHFPEITEREVRDMFSDYGKVVFPSQDDIAKQMRELRSIGQITSAIEDVEKLTHPKHTGLQREKATETVRLLRRVLNARMKENRALMEEVQSARELTSPLEAIKTRLNNQIQDLSAAINKRERETKKAGIEYDQEAKDMDDLRKQLVRILDDVAPKPQPTAQERVRAAMYAVDRQIKELQRRITEKDFTTTEQKTPITAQLQVKRDERAALSEQLGKLKEEALGKSERTQEQVNADYEKQLERDIKELERQIAEKDFAKKEGRSPEATAEIERLKAKKATLTEKRNELRGDTGKAEMSDEKRIELATKALDASIANWQKKVDAGGAEAAKRTSKTPETPELAEHRKIRDELKKTNEAMLKAKRDAARDPVEEQMKRDQAALERRIALLEKRMAEGDFAPRKKKEKVYDKRLMDVELKLADTQAKWGEMLFNHKMAQRTWKKKTWDNIFETLSLGRFFKTAGDLSAIGNQGNFALFSHPILSIKALGGMWKALQSEKKQNEVLYGLRQLPEYQSGEMKRAGLFLAMDAGATDAIQKHEELVASRWVNKIPVWAGGGLLRGSARAYTTYLDLIRVASYLSLKHNLVEGGWVTPPTETTPERLASVAYLINNATGRGVLMKGKGEQMLSQASPFLNTFLFAPRFGISRFAMDLGFPIWNASKGTKRLIAIEYAKYVAGLTTAMFLASMFQDDDDKDMEVSGISTDFLKTRFDNTRLDMLGGFQQPMVFMLRLLFGETKNAKGEIKPLRQENRLLNLFRKYPRTDAPKFTDRTSASMLGDFIRGKLAPVASSFVNVSQGKDVIGRPTDIKSELLTMPIPLVINQVAEMVKAQQDDPALAALLASSAIAGFRTADQDPKVNRAKMKTAWQELLNMVKDITGIR